MCLLLHVTFVREGFKNILPNLLVLCFVQYAAPLITFGTFCNATGRPQPTKTTEFRIMVLSCGREASM